MAQNRTNFQHVQGVESLSAVLRALSADMQNQILADAVGAALKPMLVAAKRFAKRSEDTGALRASLTTKVKTYPNRGKVVGLMGPDRAYYAGKKKAGKLQSLYGASKPSNYAHLVEFGHHAVAPKKGTTIRRKTATITKWVPAKPFIRPAVMTTLGEQGQQFVAGIAAGIEKTRARYVKAGLHVA